MNKRNKEIKRLLAVLICIICILISTYAWFIYNTTTRTSLNANVIMWNIKFSQNGVSEEVNPVQLDFGNVYPGMSPISKKIVITNEGDLSAKVTYKIKSIVLFNESVEFEDNLSEEEINEKLSEYPFKLNIQLDREVINKENKTAEFNATFSWDYEDENDRNEITNKDILDTYYGNKAYEYSQNQDENKNSNLSFIIEIVAKQLDEEIEAGEDI